MRSRISNIETLCMLLIREKRTAHNERIEKNLIRPEYYYSFVLFCVAHSKFVSVSCTSEYL